MYKKNKIKYYVLLYIIIFLFVVFISSSFLFINRKYTFIEIIFKKPIYKMKNHLINYVYSNNNLSNDIINSKIYYYEKQINNLKDILNLKKTNDLFLPATVVNKKKEKLFNKIEIYSKHKLHNNSPVINSNGLIGFISKTSDNIYEVNLINSVNKNNNLLVSILTNESEIKGVINKYKNNMFIISDIISKNNIKINDKVILSQYPKSNYNGLLIGYVKKIENENYGLSKKVYVKSNVNFNDLLYVLVVDYNDK